MISRRSILLGIATSPIVASSMFPKDQASNTQESTLEQLTFPAFEAINNPKPFGYDPPTQEQREKAQNIIKGTPNGPKPIDVAQSLVDRFYVSDPEAISQWPAPASWNPLVVEFF